MRILIAALLAAILLPILAHGQTPPTELSLCVEDDDCDNGEVCNLFVCVDAEGLGETCNPLSPDSICDRALRCAPDPAEPFLFRCFPKVPFDYANDSVCLGYYSRSTLTDERTYFEGSDAATFAVVESGTANYAATIEFGGVYSQTGEYGCYRTICAGLTVGVEVGTAMSTTEVFEFSKASFESPNAVTVVEKSIIDLPPPSPPVSLGFAISEAYSVEVPPQRVGTSYSLGIDVGRSPPIQIGEYYCTTDLNLVVRPPIADAGPDQVVECTSPEGALVRLDGTGSYDPDGGDIQEYRWSGSFGTAQGPEPEVELPIGSEDVSLIVIDDEGSSSEEDTTTITVEDTQPPVISVEAFPNVLWPPNNKMVTVQISADARDACDSEPVCTIENVASNESGGARRSDWKITGGLSLQLRARRDGYGSGRIYDVTVACEDRFGNRSTAIAQVSVPHDQRKDPSEAPADDSSSSDSSSSTTTDSASTGSAATATEKSSSSSRCGLGFEIAPLIVMLCIRRSRRTHERDR